MAETMVCSLCNAPVFYSEESGGWFHDIKPRSLATPARSVRAITKSVTRRLEAVAEADFSEEER